METDHFKTDISCVSLRVGRSGCRTFREILRKSPLAGMCFVEQRSDKDATYNDARTRAVMELLEA